MEIWDSAITFHVSQVHGDGHDAGSFRGRRQCRTGGVVVYFPLSRLSFLLRVSCRTSRSFLEEPQPAETATSGPGWARRGFIASSPLVLAGGVDKRWNTLEFLENCMARRKPRTRQIHSHTTAGVPSSMLLQTIRIPLEGSSFLPSPGVGKRGKCLHI